MVTKNPILIFILTTLFEIYENLDEQIIKYNRIEKDSSGKSTYRGDSFINVLGDILFNLIGVLLGYYLSFHNSILILFIIFLVVTNVVGFNYWTEFISFIQV